jgi:uncharacterized protein YeaO (DUF488 family)
VPRRKAPEIKIKRAYDDPARSDGSRVLVDRVWPRGIAKDELRLDLWLKDLAPSTGLRKWFGHDPAKWDVFKERYFRELDGQPGAVERILEEGRAGKVTLLFGAKNTQYNNAVALREYLERHPARA